MGHVVQAVNMGTDQKTAIMVDPQLIDEQDMPGLERLLRERVQLAPAGVQIFIQISEKQLRKKAKGA